LKYYFNLNVNSAKIAIDMTITFIGHGYVGLVSAAVFADLGNTVHVIGHTVGKIENLKKGIIPIYEPGLQELVKRNVDAGRLLFTLDYAPAISQSEVVFIAVGTPSAENGEADLSVVFDVPEKIGKHLEKYAVIITKSTVPVGTNKKIKQIIKNVKPEGVDFDIASVPEFLREGQAISDTLKPDRIIIGTQTEKAEKILVELHNPLKSQLVLCNIETAEMIKYASNAFLATKISFANAIAQLAEKSSADGPKVLEAVGMDKRIGKNFLNAGAGYGGSCFPKDVKALIAIAGNYGYNFKLLKEVENINHDAMLGIAAKAKQMLDNNIEGKTVALLGLAFKPDTDDMRYAPSITVIKELLVAGAKINVYDPIAADNAKKILATEKNINYSKELYATVKGVDLLIVITEWNEFYELDLEKVKNLMKKPNIIDARNIYNPQKTKELGFNYIGVGR
jgi:UDPglucose 6-dehydrogenase